MNDEKKGLFGGLESLINKFPIVREEAVMQGMEWISGSGFAWLAMVKPELATWLHETVKNNTVLTRVVLSIIGEIGSRAAGLEHDDINNARIADALVAVQNIVRIGKGVSGSGASTASGGLSILDLQKRLSSLPPDASKPIILRLGSMNDDRRRRVLHLIAQFSIDQTVNMLQMDDEVLNTMLTLGDQTAAVQVIKPEDQTLAKLRELGETLKRRTERSGEGS